jgi:hypothetical protein
MILVQVDEQLRHRLAILADVAQMSLSEFCGAALGVDVEHLWRDEYESLVWKKLKLRMSPRPIAASASDAWELGALATRFRTETSAHLDEARRISRARGDGLQAQPSR